MSNQKTKVYIRKGHGTYYISNGLIRFRADNLNSHWIDALIWTKEEFDNQVASGRLIGPIIVNNFQEKES